MRRPPRKPSALDPCLDYLQQRWDEGQHSAKILHEEPQTKGYLGHYQRVKMAGAPLRRGLPLDDAVRHPLQLRVSEGRRRPRHSTDERPQFGGSDLGRATMCGWGLLVLHSAGGA